MPYFVNTRKLEWRRQAECLSGSLSALNLGLTTKLAIIMWKTVYLKQ